MTSLQALALNGGPPVRDSFLVFGQPDIQEAEIQEVVSVLRSKWIGTGPRCQQFEEQFREYIGCRHALSLNSCTAGMELALDVLGIGRGDEVVTTPLTFAATANVIVHRGAKPVFVDVDPGSGNIDPARVEEAITERTKAILPVHLYGQPAPMNELLQIARQHELHVIEDAAHAIEAWYQGQKIGAIGDITVFSFYATKNLTTAEGGMLVTENDDWAEEARIKHLHGLSKDAWKRYSDEGFQPYDVTFPGYKYNMTDIQAALGIHQLARLEDNLKIRERYWSIYREAFSDVDEISLPEEKLQNSENGLNRHARHLFTIQLNLEKLSISRWDFVNALKAENIGTGIHFLALHLHSYYREKYDYVEGAFPHVENIADRTLSLPLSPGMTETDLAIVIQAVKKVIGHSKI